MGDQANPVGDASSSAWDEAVIDATLDEADLSEIIFSYLVHYCYGETAEIFGKACLGSNLSLLAPAPREHGPNEDSIVVDFHRGRKMQDHLEKYTNTMNERKKLYRLITQGHIAEALDLCRASFPEILDFNDTKEGRKTLFKLQSLMFIEYVRSGLTKEALTYAQTELIRYGPDISGFSEPLQVSRLTPANLSACA